MSSGYGDWVDRNSLMLAHLRQIKTDSSREVKLTPDTTKRVAGHGYKRHRRWKNPAMAICMRYWENRKDVDLGPRPNKLHRLFIEVEVE